VEAAIRGLNGATHNDVYLCTEPTVNESYLCVGGGYGRYIVTGATKGGRFPTLTDPTRAPEPRETLVVGGQPGDYPGHYVVPLAMALRAARIYFDTGAFNSDSPWVET
jgi:immunity protein Imm1 of predicted polymorphic toxin system